eukprot:7220592-Pyramimonas_sp.AAC.1
MAHRYSPYLIQIVSRTLSETRVTFLHQVKRCGNPRWDEFFRYDIKTPQQAYLAIALVSRRSTGSIGTGISYMTSCMSLGPSKAKRQLARECPRRKQTSQHACAGLRFCLK